MIAEILGPDILIVLAVLVLLFGGSQIPKLARSLGTARKEFESGLHGEGDKSDAKKSDSKASESKANDPAPQNPSNN
ncbi:MAG TPA: twin-arginine translocase TatA/TatE family subunit [Acidimicrobiia bacterium]|jgi:sec-independent protein translocase protein TatA